MGKKILGGKKKKKAAAVPEEGKPVVAPLTEDQAYEAKNGRKRAAPKAGLGTIFGTNGTLGG